MKRILLGLAITLMIATGALADTSVYGGYLPSTGGTVTGDVAVTGDVSANTVTIGSTTASKPVFTDANKKLVSTGTLGVDQGGSGRVTGTTAYSLLATGTTATGAQQTLANGATTEVLVGGGASALPVWTTATGTGAPVRAGSPTFTGTVTAPVIKLTTGAAASRVLTSGADGTATWENPGVVSSVSKSSAYTILDTDPYQTFYVSGNTTIKLPVASMKRSLRFKKTDTNTTTVTIQKSDTGADTIEDVATTILTDKFDSVTLESDGTATWYKF